MFGCIVTAFSIPTVYLLVTGAVRPGELCCMGEKAGTIGEELAGLGLAVAVLLIGVALKEIAVRFGAPSRTATKDKS